MHLKTSFLFVLEDTGKGVNYSVVLNEALAFSAVRSLMPFCCTSETRAGKLHVNKTVYRILKLQLLVIHQSVLSCVCNVVRSELHKCISNV
jgi:hypothetical protein